MGRRPDGDARSAKRPFEPSESEEDLMTGSIICGVDDSESARGAARVARELSGQTASRLVFVRVADAGSPQEEISAVAARLQRLAECATEVDCGAHWLVEVGHPADRLVAVAKKEAASLIVVGSSGPRSSLLGSISADVSRRAPCPVVVVAPGADLSVTNGNARARVRGRTGLTSLVDDGYTGATGGFDAAWGPNPASGDGVREDPDARDFAGGIVRFGIGGGTG
jgi:nucleotide-binding universal stress UspA family protein